VGVRVGRRWRLGRRWTHADAEAAALATQIASSPTAATQAIVRCVGAAAGGNLRPGMRTELDELLELFASDDGRAGIEAFIARRTPPVG
jgi:enoyl-CoA hydratase/carnithine racemase